MIGLPDASVMPPPLRTNRLFHRLGHRHVVKIVGHLIRRSQLRPFEELHCRDGLRRLVLLYVHHDGTSRR